MMKKNLVLKKLGVILSLLVLTLGQTAPILADTISTVVETQAESPESSETEEVTESTATSNSSSSLSESSQASTESTADSEETAPTETTSSTTDASSESSSSSETSATETTASSSSQESESSETSTTQTTESTSDSSESSTPSSSTTTSEKPKEKPAPAPAPTSPAEPEVVLPVEPSETVELPESSLPNFSDLTFNDYELPLLASFKDQKRAVLVFAALQELAKPYDETGKKKDHFSNRGFVEFIYQEVFGTKLDLDRKEMDSDKAQAGDLLLWKEKGKISKVGLALGQNKVILADEPSKEEMTAYQEAVKKDEKAKEPAGVRIFSMISEKEEKEREDEFPIYGETIKPADAALSYDTNESLSEKGEALLKSYPATFDFRQNEMTQRFVDKIGNTARELGMKYDVFASVMIAQAILESGSGSSGLSLAPYYNLFGIKGSNNQASVSFATQEDNGNGQLYTIQSAFRIYPSLEDSLKDYVQLLKGGISGNEHFYKDSWRSEAGNYLKATANLTGKYATDTHYHNKLNSIIATYHLTQFDGPEKGKILDFKELKNVPESYRKKVSFPVYNGVNYNVSGSYGSDQCTWYVFNRVTQLGGHVGDYMGNGADWGTTGKQNGYAVSNQPKAGDVISFKQGVAGYHPLYGHVGVVEAVTDEGVLFSEGDINYLNYRVIPNSIALSSDVIYITPK